MAGLACAGFVLLLTPSGSLPSPSRRWRWWARALGAAPAAFLVTVALLPAPLDPTYESIVNPLGLAGDLPVEAWAGTVEDEAGHGVGGLRVHTGDDAAL
jgi:hypothetical protein